MILMQVPANIYERCVYVYMTLLLCDLLTIVFDSHSKKTTLILLDLFIKLMAASNNLMLWTNNGNVVLRANGTAVVIQRYIQWGHTTPTMLIMLGYLSDSSCFQLLPTLVWNELMIMTGMCAAVTVGFVSFVSCCLSFACFVPVVWGMRSMFSVIIHATHKLGHPRDVKSLWMIQQATICIWSLFGVIFVLGELKVVSMPVYESMMAYVDFAAKVIFSNSLLLRNTRSIEIKRWAMMRTIELFGKEKVRRPTSPAVNLLSTCFTPCCCFANQSIDTLYVNTSGKVHLYPL